MIGRDEVQLHKIGAACELLGVGPSTLKALIRAKEIRVVRIGRCLRISHAELARFIKNLEKKST